MMSIDTHAHVFVRGLHLAAVRRYAPDYDAPLAAYLAQLARHGMTHGVLVQPSFLGTDNRFMLDAIRSSPLPLRGIGVVDPDIPRETLAAMAGEGMAGIRLNLIGKDIPDFYSGPWPRFLRDLAQLGMQVEIHRAAADLPHIIAPLVAAGVNVVVDHFGRPDPSLGVRDPGFAYLLSIAATRKVWVKISAAYRNGDDAVGERIARDAIPLLLAAFGAERLLWGSDWPHTQFETTVDYGTVRALLDDWIPDVSVRRTILATTPAELFRF
ncbi:amidohydrolase family protein [Noviherbaspirillum sp.]|uniref:amidohydrolase family protein n=1 Tax=Noviherbaspirillum sp. TaxID=1926288 RepID=UPI002B4921A0|nr:amidohydrolase family protein [Noviherbaspirillum sp.]HJV82371.1 amidohydrolase family protein [Noviherbaspirillum sp.]